MGRPERGVRSQFSLCGRCWIRTNVGEADGFTDRHSKSIPLGQIVLPVSPWDGMGIGDPHATIASRCHSDIRDKKPERCAKRVNFGPRRLVARGFGLRPQPWWSAPVRVLLEWAICQGALTSTKTLPEISEFAATANASFTSSIGIT
jgi:hypothetical protein